MSARTPNAPRRRIVLALEPAAREASAIDILQHLVGEDLFELLGLIVEDPRALEHAGSHLAREVVLSGSERPLEPGALTRQLRAQAEHTRRRVAEVVARLGLPGRFEVERGELGAVLARSAKEAETIMVLADALESAERRQSWRRLALELQASAARSLLIARAGWARGRSVVAVIDDFARAEALLAAARRLAARSRSPLRLLVVGRSSEARSTLKQQIEATRTEDESTVTIERSAWHGSELVATVSETRPRLVVMPWPDEAGETNGASELFERTRSAILLIK